MAEYKSLIERVRETAAEHDVRIEPDTRETPPETMEEAVADLINMEYVATDLETGETARGESMEAAWANLRGVSKREIHNRLARSHREGGDDGGQS